MEEDTSAFKMLTGKPTEICPLESPTCKLEGIIRIDPKEIDTALYCIILIRWSLLSNALRPF